MKIGIIGAGNIGGNLTRRFRALGNDVAVANSRGPDTLGALAKETGASAVTVAEAARDKDVVIVTIPLKSVPALPKDLFASARPTTVVIDTGNYYPQQRDGRIDAIEQGSPESAWVARQLGRPVVKAFNNIYAKHILEGGNPKGTKGRVALPIAGDDAAAKEVVARLLDTMGFDAVDAGPLAESWRQQPGTPVYGTDMDAEGVRRGLADAPKDRPQSFRAATK